ncbi:MAG: Holliday junction resolvase RuvX, partial [Bacteroidota bacterium]|nr:Holliday junction resolvase RuvX [Bacteroidota bacterium]
NALDTIDTPKLFSFLKDYFSREPVELILIGEPKNLDDSDTHATPLVRKAIERLRKEFPLVPVQTVDERYSSKLAKEAMLQMGMKKMQRRDKAMVDKIAATILLQEYLAQRG